jgi:RNA recognition motif-containing protein
MRAREYCREGGPARKEAVMAMKSIYVGNLSYSTTESSLRELFAEFEPAEVRLIGDKGFGFVDVPEEKMADAIASLNGREVDGRALTVSEARPRRERRDGFGGGGRRW